jgi:hypothetical protein
MADRCLSCASTPGHGRSDQPQTGLRLACRIRSGENEALDVCSRDATANRLIVDSVDPGIRQQYQNGVGTGFVMADAILPKGHVKTAQSILWRIRERRFSD